MKECAILVGQNILRPLLHIFRRSRPPALPCIYIPVSMLTLWHLVHGSNIQLTSFCFVFIIIFYASKAAKHVIKSKLKINIYRNTASTSKSQQDQQAVGGRAATIYPRPSPHSVGAEAPRAAEPTAAPADGNVAVGSHAQYVPTLTAVQLPDALTRGE